MQRSRLGGAALLVAALVFIGAGLSRISFDVNILKLLPTHLPQVEGLSLFLKHFSQPTELIITVEAETAEKAEAAADDVAGRLAGHPELAKRVVSRAPWEKNPADLAELLAFLVLNQPPEKIAELKARLAPKNTAATLQATLEKLNDSISPQEIALRSYDPFDLTASAIDPSMMGGAQMSEFASADGTFRVIYVEAPHAFSNYKATHRWIEEIKRQTAEVEPYFGVKLGFTGEPAFVADISASTEWDMMSSGFVTLALIALIFWLCYRRARPLLELQSMLVLIFTLTLATAGLFLSQLTVIGVGCAAIMIGLSVDYGYFVFQRSRQHVGSVSELQRQCVQNIAWTASTTAAVFFALNWSSLPGLSQLGNLVGIGVVIGACVMLGVFAPLTMRRRRVECNSAGESSSAGVPACGSGCPGPVPTGQRPSVAGGDACATTALSPVERIVESPHFYRLGAWATGLVIAALLGGVAIKGFPQADFSSRTLRPRHSEAYDALERLQQKLINDSGFVSLIASGKTEAEVLTHLRTTEERLRAAKARGEIKSFRTALPLWPDPAHQRQNLPQLAALAPELPRLQQAIRNGGFNDEAFGLTDAVIQQWAAWEGSSRREEVSSASALEDQSRPTSAAPSETSASAGNSAVAPAPAIWPENEASRWIFRRLASRGPEGFFALGMIEPVPQHEAALNAALQTDGLRLASWNLLGAELKRVIPREFLHIILAITGFVFLLLLVGFRSLRGTFLFFATTALVLLCLAGAMSLLGMQWNFFNLAAVLLLLGTGTDYSILLLLALKRNGGDALAAQRELGLVVCLCCSSAASGFGTISWANNLGLASLGQTCALGLAIDALISLFLLPRAWTLLHPRAKAAATAGVSASRP